MILPTVGIMDHRIITTNLIITTTTSIMIIIMQVVVAVVVVMDVVVVMGVAVVMDVVVVLTSMGVGLTANITIVSMLMMSITITVDHGLIIIRLLTSQKMSIVVRSGLLFHPPELLGTLLFHPL